jgi:hypothetical protein
MVGRVSLIVAPLLLLGATAFFMIRGYRLTAQTLLVQRLGWQTALSLDDLQSAEVDPEAMRRSLRTFGNGGLFCVAGHFWNRKLGAYRAFATDPQRAVVLRFSNRTVVVTPDRPETFVAMITPSIASRGYPTPAP